MISQQRFEELVKLGQKGGLAVNEAINLAVHESLDAKHSKEVRVLIDKKVRELARELDRDWEFSFPHLEEWIEGNSVIVIGLDEFVSLSTNNPLGVDHDENWRD